MDPRDQFRFVTDLTVRGKEALIKLGLEFAVAPAVVDKSISSLKAIYSPKDRHIFLGFQSFVLFF